MKVSLVHIFLGPTFTSSANNSALSCYSYLAARPQGKVNTDEPSTYINFQRPQEGSKRRQTNKRCNDEESGNVKLKHHRCLVTRLSQVSFDAEWFNAISLPALLNSNSNKSLKVPQDKFVSCFINGSVFVNRHLLHLQLKMSMPKLDAIEMLVWNRFVAASEKMSQLTNQ